MSITFGASVSGMQAAFLRQDVTANNVANVNTPKFGASTVGQTEMLPEGVRISSIDRTPNDSAELSNTDLAKEMTDMIINKDASAVNGKVLKVKNKMLGDLMDIFA